MIKVNIFHQESGKPDLLLGEIEIERLPGPNPNPDYSVRFAFENGDTTVFSQRSIQDFSRQTLNVMRLIERAISELTNEELLLEGDIDGSGSSDMARRQPGVIREIQGWPDQLRNN